MSEPGWKKFEARCAAFFGGRRRGAQTSRNREGLTDVADCKAYGIECKLLKSPSYGHLLAAAKQAEGASDLDQLPIGIVKRKGDHDKNALVVMRLETFLEWFGHP